MKECKDCKQIKPLDEFIYYKRGGVDCRCKPCSKLNRAKYRKTHSDDIKRYMDIYRQENKDKIAQKSKLYKESHKDEIRRHNKANIDRISAWRKQYREKNRIKILQKQKEYYTLNKPLIAAKRKLNQKRWNIKRNIRNRQRLNSDLNFKIACSLRSRLSASIRNNARGGSAVRDLGCIIEELKAHLESKFYNRPITNEQMTWENWKMNGWHIDHKVPLSFFDLTDREQFIKACHYTNLQPLWSEHNLSKNNNANWSLE